jgi:hypothetical protein
MRSDFGQRRNVEIGLERDWGRLARRELHSALVRWQRSEQRLERFSSPEDLLAQLLADSLRDGDGPLRSLLALAPAEPLAARLVLQAIVPILEQQARWLACHRAHVSSGCEGFDEVWELLCFHAWETISSGFSTPRRLVLPQLLGEILCRTLTALAPDGPPESGDAHPPAGKRGQQHLGPRPERRTPTPPPTSPAPREAL